jgi:sulfide:quinone oxidoreductase
MAGKNVVVLGAGVGGLVAASRLRSLLPKEHRVVLVDRSAWHTFAPGFLAVMLGKKRVQQISRDLRRLERKGIEFVLAEIVAIDLAGRKVRLHDRELGFDYLIVALGVQYSTGGIPGLATAYTYYHPEGAEALPEQLEKLTSGNVAVVVAGLPYKCPAAPYEGALLIDEYYRKKGLRKDVEVRLFTPEPAPMPVAGQAVGHEVTELLTERGIWFSPNARLKAVDPKAHKLFFEDGSDAPCDLVVGVPVHEAPTLVREAGLEGESGWVEVDRETLATKHEGVFAIGDVTTIPLANGKALPKAGVFAHGEAEVVARNVAAEVTGGQGIWAFGGEGACFLETGRGKAAYVTGRFFAEPEPEVELHGPGRYWRWAKEGFIRSWLWRWF